MKKIEDKNSIRSYFSDTTSMTTKSTYSFKGWTFNKTTAPHTSQNKFSNVKSRYAAANMLESSNRAATSSKKPSIYDNEGKIEERDDEDQLERGPAE